MYDNDCKFERLFFMFKSNNLCTSEKLVVFSVVDRAKGTGGADIHTMTIWREG